MPGFAVAARKEYRNSFDGNGIITCMLFKVWKLVNKYKFRTVSIQVIASDCVQISYNVQESYQEIYLVTSRKQ